MSVFTLIFNVCFCSFAMQFEKAKKGDNGENLVQPRDSRKNCHSSSSQNTYKYVSLGNKQPMPSVANVISNMFKINKYKWYLLTTAYGETDVIIMNKLLHHCCTGHTFCKHGLITHLKKVFYSWEQNYQFIKTC